MRVLPQPFKIIMLWSFVAARDFWLYVKIRLLCPGRLSFTYCLEERIRFLNFPHLFSIIHQSVPILRRRKQNKNKKKNMEEMKRNRYMMHYQTVVKRFAVKKKNSKKGGRWDYIPFALAYGLKIEILHLERDSPLSDDLLVEASCCNCDKSWIKS